MNFKKLSLAAAISIGIFTAGTAAQSQVGEMPSTVAQTNCPPTNPAPQAQAQPSAYGGGAAGTFKITGTEQPYGGNAAGSTEISTFRSPVNQPTAGSAAMAAQGIYGQCAPCGPASTGGAAGIITPPQLQSVESPSQMTIQQTVATPTTSELTGGAAEAQSQGMRCATPPAEQAPAITMPCPVTAPATIAPSSTIPVSPVAPVTPGAAGGAAEIESGTSLAPMDTSGAALSSESQTVMPISPSVAGGAAQVCPTTPTCIPGASLGVERNANAPKGFDEPVNPGSIAKPITGGAAPVTTICPAPACPVQPSSVIPSETMPIQPTGRATQVMPIDVSAAPVAPAFPAASACPSQVCPVTPITGQQPITVSPTAVTGAQAAMAQYAPVSVAAPFCPTGAAAPITGPVSGSCGSLSTNTEYIERQVYAYPKLPDSVNAMIPGGAGSAVALGSITPNMVVSTNNPGMAMSMPSSITTYPGMSGYATGAAAPITTTTGVNAFGCPITSSISSGASVSRLPVKAPAGPISIQTQSGYQIQRMVLVPAGMTGAAAAAPIENMFTDISSNFWASNSINRLASSGVISGYPDRTFRPSLPVSRAEFASMLVTGLNIQNTPTIPGQVFRDVPNNYWASNSIDKAYNRGLIAGYSNDTFMPNSSISRAEALTTMSKALPASDMTATDADQILSQYNDADQVPNWARIPVAKAVKAGLLQGTPYPNRINANSSASRADVASMLSQLRQDLALEQPAPTVAMTGGAASIQQQTVTIPVLNVKFNDRITARANHVGDKFSATTLEPVTIDNVIYPQGSKVNGKIVEVIRPSGNNQGALKLAFTDISNSNGTISALPSDVITAQVQKDVSPNVLSRVLEFPFVLPGRIIGTVGRTVGTMTVIAGNSTEQVFNGLGIAAGDLGGANWSSAGRSAVGSAVALGRGTVDTIRTAFNGASGIFNVASDELGYLTSPGGEKVASINPDELVSIAFGCQ